MASERCTWVQDPLENKKLARAHGRRIHFDERGLTLTANEQTLAVIGFNEPDRGSRRTYCYERSGLSAARHHDRDCHSESESEHFHRHLRLVHGDYCFFERYAGPLNARPGSARVNRPSSMTATPFTRREATTVDV